MATKSPAEKSEPLRFMATIYKIWMLRYVDVPEEISRALKDEYGKKKYIPVTAIVNARSTRTTLTPAGAGRFRRADGFSHRAYGTAGGSATSLRIPQCSLFSLQLGSSRQKR